ncbi:MAG: porin [Pirellulaceae bacterium]
MKCTRLALMATLASGLVATSVQGQSPRGLPVRSAALSYDYYQQDGDYAPSPSDYPVPQVPAYEAAPSCACQAESLCCEAAEPACDPWRVFPEICGWQIYGFLNGSATANADSPASHFNGPVTFLDREEVRLNQAYMTVEKIADGSNCCLDWGGRVDLLYGTDYVFTQAAGLELQQNGDPHWNRRFQQYGLALPQAYAEAAYGDLSVKIGHFYTIIGYQVVPATGNFFVTQPYTFQYGEPFTHTGALATWKYSDTVTLYGGLVNGWDKLDADSDVLATMVGIQYSPDHGAYNIYLTGIVGEEDGIAVPTLGTRALYSLVFTYNISNNWQYVLQHDNGWQNNGGVAGQDAEWYGVNNYLFYTVNECWKLGARAEWFRDDDGARLNAAPVRLGGAATAAGLFGVAAPAAGDFAGNYYEVALGANWTPHANLIVRPELRWDWSDGNVAAPYDDFTKDSQFIAAVDAIVLY